MLAAACSDDARRARGQPGQRTRGRPHRRRRTSGSSQPTVFAIAASGDLLAHGPVMSRAARDGSAAGQAYDFRPMLAPVEPVLAADLGICHLGTPLSPDNRNLSSYPSFNVPHEMADAFAASGYDTCSVASNHSLDRGAAGVAATLDALDAVGVARAGTARTASEAATRTLRPVKGVTVAPTLDDPATAGSTRRELERSWRHTVGAISALGADTQGVVPDEVPHAVP